MPEKIIAPVKNQMNYKFNPKVQYSLALGIMGINQPMLNFTASHGHWDFRADREDTQAYRSLAARLVGLN